jgi:DNA recombination protein RmuC
MLEEFVKRKHNPAAIKFDHPLLEPILKETYGIILYQEQVMQIAVAMGGFTPGQADGLRKAMGKKIPEELEKQRGAFMKGAADKKIPEKVAHQVFEQIVYFGGYGFNKSHSTAYGLVSYQTAYLKANYPLEYMTALMTSEIVDAVVFIKDKIIPIDSKFSLENYNKMVEMQDLVEKDKLEKLFVNDLKNRISETAKYIRPTENTMEFAFMFIPHEAIYYDLLTNKVGALREESENLIQRAASKYKVIIVSPTSFLAYLQTVLQGLKAMQIEETAKDIIKRVDELGKHLKTYEEYHNKLGTSLNTVANHYNASSKELKKVDKDVMRITGENIGIETLLVEKPESEE